MIDDDAKKAVDNVVKAANDVIRNAENSRNNLSPQARMDLASLQVLLNAQIGDAKRYLNDAELKYAARQLASAHAEGAEARNLTNTYNAITGEMERATDAGDAASVDASTMATERNAEDPTDSVYFDAAYEMHQNPERSAREVLEDQYNKTMAMGYSGSDPTAYGTEEDRQGAYEQMGREYNGSMGVSLSPNEYKKYQNRYKDDESARIKNNAIKYTAGAIAQRDGIPLGEAANKAINLDIKNNLHEKIDPKDEQLLRAAGKHAVEQGSLGKVDPIDLEAQGRAKSPLIPSLTNDEVEQLRRNNPEEYNKLVNEGRKAKADDDDTQSPGKGKDEKQEGKVDQQGESPVAGTAPIAVPMPAGGGASPRPHRRYAQPAVGRKTDPETGKPMQNATDIPDGPHQGEEGLGRRRQLSGKGDGNRSFGERLGNMIGDRMSNIPVHVGSAMNKARDGAKSMMNTLKTWGTRLRHTFHSIVATVTNPYFWIGVIAVVLCIALVTTVQTFGPSDISCNSTVKDGATDSGTSGGKLDASKAMEESAKQVYSALKKYGLNDSQIAGILSNWQVEGGMDPTSVETIFDEPYQTGSRKKEAEKDWNSFVLNKVFPSYAGGIDENGYRAEDGKYYPGIGMGQWTGPRAKKVLDTAHSVGEKWNTMKFQMAYSLSIDSAHFSEYKKQDGDPTTLAGWFYSNFEMPGHGVDPKHTANAQSWYEKMKSWNADDSFGSEVLDLAKKIGMTSDSGASSSSGGESNDFTGANCINVDKENGAVSGTQECDKGTCDYSWMCKDTGICKDGDGFSGNRIVYPQNVSKYQCVWYAWNRLGMLHPGWKNGEWNWVMGDGGDIWKTAQSTSGWEVDTTPHAGDGISGHASPFAGSTHVAVVEKVEGDRIYISEGNTGGHIGCTSYGGCWDGYHTRWLTKDVWSAGDIHFFRHTSWKK